MNKRLEIFCKNLPATNIKGVKLSAQEFLTACIEGWTKKGVGELLSCSTNTVDSHLKIVLPNLRAATRVPIGQKILELIEHKKCYVCKEVLTLEFFSKNKHNQDGIQKSCKACDNKKPANKERAEVYRQVPSVKRSRCADQNKRRSAKMERTPVWADLEAIKTFYKNCPEGYHVDHIIPLQGDLVSGFHVLSNLQYLMASENLSKSNSYKP